MTARMGRLGSDTGMVQNTDSQVNDAPARRYASFVVRGWRPGVAGSLVVAHDQSGEHVQTDSLVEAIGWIQSRATTSPGQAPASQGDEPQRARVSPPDTIVRGGDRQTKIDPGAADPLAVAAA
jgi:hypothetical protein